MQTVTQVAKAALFRSDGKILILTRSQTALTRLGLYDLPGGGIEQGEDAKTAVLREIQEEIGLVLPEQAVNFVFADTNFYEGRTTIRFLFTGVIEEDLIKLSFEHSEKIWMTLDEAKQKYDPPVWIKAIEYARDHDLLPPVAAHDL